MEHAIEISVRAYRLLLRAFPPELRDAYGLEMAQCFRDLCRDGAHAGGMLGLATVWAQTLIETPSVVLRDRNITLLNAINRDMYRAAAGIAFVAGLILSIPLIAMRFSNEVQWGLIDFVVAGALLFGVGFTFVLATRLTLSTLSRTAIGIGFVAALMLVWAELGVGVFTSLGS